MQEKLHGVFPALVTPLTADGDVDHGTLAEFVDYLIGDCGVNGVIPLGSTGEFYALSRVEREAVLGTTVEAAGGRVPVVAGANAGSTADVMRYAGQAEQMGAAGVKFYRPSPGEKEQWVGKVGSQLAMWNDVKKRLAGSLKKFDEFKEAADTTGNYFISD